LNLPFRKSVLKIHEHLLRLNQVTPSLAPSRPVRAYDFGAVTATIERALSAAGLNTGVGPLKNVNDTIQHALSAAGLVQRGAASSGHATMIEGVGHAVDTPSDDTGNPSVEPIERAKPPQPGEFVTRSFTGSAGTRIYKLYVPASYCCGSREPLPLVVMLHGCTQSPDDFAVGTRMNELAEQHGFLVAYPAQAANANGAKCWNWFRLEDQGRDRGEPSLIAGITREVTSSYCVDERRIFVAGMSAGAAMAVVLGASYPELYAAVGAHSGLAYGAAHDLPSAMSAMQGGARNARPQIRNGVPTIVFHGDRDPTVNARNGAAIVEQAVVARSDEAGLHKHVDRAAASAGRTFTRTVFADGSDQPVVEHWVLHGAGHAWSGGNPSGSFTDAAGPDASAEMIRFFHSQTRAGTA
jgi:poly(hydroxyalkanoate) depolymerase family esterase